MPTIIKGSCLCGSVLYQIKGKLLDARSCHCQDCRKAFSAQASAYALVKAKEFSWILGEDLVSSFESKKGDGLLFCSVCGSTLCGTYKGEVHGVTLGCIDGNPDVTIKKHIFVADKASWEVMPKGVLQYEKEAPENIF